MNSGTNPSASFPFGGGTGTPASSAQTTGGFPFGSGGGFNFGSKPNFSFGTPTASTTASVLSTAATNPTFGTAGNFGALKSTTTTTGSQFGMPNTTLSTQCVFGTAASGTFGGVQATTQNMAGISGQSTTQPTGLFSGLSSGTPATTQGLFTASASATFSTPQKTGSAGLFSGVAAPVGGGQSSATFSTPPKTGSAGLFSGVAAPVGGGQSIFQQKSAPNTGGTTTLFSGATTSVANPSFNFGSSASSTATAAPSFASTSTTLGSQPGMMFGAPGTGATKGFSFSAVSLASTTNGAQATNTTFAGFAVPKPGTAPTLGGTTSAPAQNAGTGFKLGGVSTATATPSTAGAVGTTFSGIAATKPSTGFNLGGTSVSATTTQAGGAGFKLGGGTTQATTPQTTGAGFKVGGSTNTAQPGLTGAASTTPVASFGTTTASTSSQPMQKLALGQSTTGFNFAGQLSGQAKTPATTTPASTTANSGLTGTNTNLVFAAKVNTPLHGTKPLLPATTVSTTKPTLGLTMPQTSTSATSGFKLGSSASGTTTTATASGFKLPVATSSTAAPSATTTTASTEKYTYKQLEDQVNKWNIEVEEMERAFLEQAAQVNVADRELMENGEKIAVLHSEVERAKADQNRLNQELDFLVSQQNELEDLLKPLEDSVKQHSLEHNQEPDRERERIYGMAEKCDGQLKGMVQDLREIIDYLNSTNANQQQQDNPVIQIAKILNVHMDSLQWIDQNSALLQKRVDEIARLNDLRRRDHERSFRLGFD